MAGEEEEVVVPLALDDCCVEKEKEEEAWAALKKGKEEKEKVKVERIEKGQKEEMAGVDRDEAVEGGGRSAVLVVTREAQAQNGLRHGDHDRYRQYCGRKIRKLRANVNLQQTKGRKYIAKPVTAENATSVTALLIVLFQAERDWAFAMALKRDVAEEPRKRFHIIKRMRRASEHAARLATLCEALGPRCASRTLLGAQAYRHYLDGLVHLETQHWQNALDALIQARAILTGLADSGTAEQTAICNARIEEVDPSIRYSAYNLGQLSGGGDEKELSELIRKRLAAAGAGGAWEALAARMEALAVQDGKKANALREISWGGQRVPVRSIKVAELLAAVDEQWRALDAAAADALGSYDKLLSTCSDAVAAAQADLKADEAATAAAKSTKGQETTAQLRAVHAYATYQRLAALAGRGSIVITQTLERIPGELSAAPASTERPSSRAPGRLKPAKLEDVVHHYDQLLQNWTDARALPGLDDDKVLARTVEGRALLARGYRLHYCGRLNETAKQWPQALALYTRSDEMLTKAAAAFVAKDGMPVVADGAEAAERLVRINRGRRAIVKADALLGTGAASPSPAPDAATARTAGVALEHRLDETVDLDTADLTQLHLVDLPPQFAVAPVKPVFFDVAENHVTTPSLTHRHDARRSSGGITGLLSGWFGGKK